MPRRIKPILGALAAGVAGLALTLPALGQQAPQSLLPPGFGAPAPARPAPSTPSAPAAAPTRSLPPPVVPAEPEAAPPPPPVPGADEGIAETNGSLQSLDALVNAITTPAEEMPASAKRSLDMVGTTPIYGTDAFGDADGRYLATLMRRVQTPIASRWAEITLRRMLVQATPAPRGEDKADWVADRAALLLRLGEADAARRLVQGVDVDNFSPRLRRVAIGSALANADPAGLCPLPDGAEQVGDQPIWPMIRAMCATLSGDEATANATIGRAPQGDPIDHKLAEKLVAAGGGGRREVTIDWTGIDSLTDWRFGIASALGVLIPQSLLDAAPAWFQAWLARAPMLSAANRVAPARVATAIGPMSSVDLVDLYGAVMDESGEQDTDSPAGRLRAAYRGDDDDARLSAMHVLWDAAANGEGGERDKYAASILTARAAAGIKVSSDQSDDVAPLVASMLSAGLDLQAQRWASVAEAAGGADGDRAWAMLAVGASRPVVQVTADRLGKLADRGGETGRHRTALLLAGLLGLGRVAPAEVTTLAQEAGLAVNPSSPYAKALKRAVDGRQRGTIALLVAVGMQNPRWQTVPAGDFYQMIAALNAIGMKGEARMIAAEAMARL
ncbi:hypothetical protein [Sphingomonas sp. MMS24-J13]|uniref:hypothetical protein n=1 Tax=Sphingomonas sp. MMS24-J13 TaxID=3238686 RepID=UPI00384AE7FC